MNNVLTRTNAGKMEFLDRSTGTTMMTIDGTLLTITIGTGVTLDTSAASVTQPASESFTNIDAGASGTAGTVDIFPTTAAKGKIQIAAADSAGDTTTTITNASQAGAATYTIPDAGGSASFVMTEGSQTVNGTKTIAALVTTNLDAGASGTAGTVDVFPTTASKGKIAISAADSAGNTTTTITNASQAGARTYTIPDAGASASFLMTEGAQTIVAATTFTAGIVLTTTATVTFGEGGNVVTGATTGTKIGTATTQKLAFHNSTPVVQRSGVAQAAVVTTGATSTVPFGYTEAQANAIVTLVNELRAALVEKGLIAGA